MQTVTIDRHKYIGGSDISIILGINPFKTRFELLLEKAQLKENDFEGNKYTEYGNLLEPEIRDYINKNETQKFIEDKIIQNDLRYHSDGFNGKCVLEIKTTSQIKDSLAEYKIYLVQLLFGMQINKVKKGKLAIYERPKDFNEELDVARLKIYDIDVKDYKELLEEIEIAIEQFRKDLIKVKENPFITEEQLQPKELIKLSNKVVKIEEKLKEFKELEEESKKLKSNLKIAMENYGVTKWTTNNGTKITLVDDKDDEEIEVEIIDEDKFIAENTKLHSQYHNKLAEYKTLQKQIKKGKKGYMLITLPKV